MSQWGGSLSFTLSSSLFIFLPPRSLPLQLCQRRETRCSHSLGQVLMHEDFSYVFVKPQLFRRKLKQPFLRFEDIKVMIELKRRVWAWGVCSDPTLAVVTRWSGYALLCCQMWEKESSVWNSTSGDLSEEREGSPLMEWHLLCCKGSEEGRGRRCGRKWKVLDLKALYPRTLKHRLLCREGEGRLLFQSMAGMYGCFKGRK